MRFALLLFAIGFSFPANAKCIQYKVQAGDTLGKISQHFFGTRNKAGEIYVNSKLTSSNIHKDQILYIFIATEDDWNVACYHIIIQRLAKFRQYDKFDLASEIPVAIETISTVLDLTPQEKLRYCRLALTTAEQESFYEFAIGAVGEIGMFQTRLATARDTIEYWSHRGAADYLPTTKDLSDKTLVTYLLDNVNAAVLYGFHITRMLRKCGGNANIWCAFKNYNGSGPAAIIYAERAMGKYREIKKLPPFPLCKEPQL